jgi:hypothetical protein
MSYSFQVTFDAHDPVRLADFWKEALGYQRPAPPSGYASWESFLGDKGIPEEEWGGADALVDPDGDGPRLYFQKVPESKTAKNRMHLDINVADRDTDAFQRRIDIDKEVDRLIAHGATRVEDVDERDSFVWTVMNDPEGNEFCVH